MSITNFENIAMFLARLFLKSHTSACRILLICKEEECILVDEEGEAGGEKYCFQRFLFTHNLVWLLDNEYKC